MSAETENDASWLRWNTKQVLQSIKIESASRGVIVTLKSAALYPKNALSESQLRRHNKPEERTQTSNMSVIPYCLMDSRCQACIGDSEGWKRSHAKKRTPIKVKNSGYMASTATRASGQLPSKKAARFPSMKIVSVRLSRVRQLQSKPYIERIEFKNTRLLRYGMRKLLMSHQRQRFRDLRR